MNTSFRFLALTVAETVFNTVAAFSSDVRWSEEQAKLWYANQPWPVGCNYVPSSAINQIDTWQAGDFDPATIDRELGWAESIGFNTVRVFLHNLVWENDPEGFKRRLGQFLDLCEKHHQRAVVTFFTNGVYGAKGEPAIGKQPLPSRDDTGWVQSPGAIIVNDPTKWGPLEKYVKDIVGCFARDPRILLWSLYNEPECTKKGAKSLPLLRKVFEWARSVNPTQPLSAPIWCIPGKPDRTVLDIVSFIGEQSDVITFHCYGDPAELKAFIRLLRAFNRPLICTEYLTRPRSTFQNFLPILKEARIGALNWGLSPCKFNAQHRWGGNPPKHWKQHIFRLDGTPYDPAEIAFIRQLTGIGGTGVGAAAAR